MSHSPETKFTASVNRHLPSIEKLYRMKNHNVYNAGVPDSWYSGDFHDLWVEWKYIMLPKRPTTKVVIPLSGLQKHWISKRISEGRNVWVIVGFEEGGVIMLDDGWSLPWTGPQLRDSCQTRQELAERIVDFCCQS